MPYASFGDPQSLNLYAYVENAPVNRADAEGHNSLPVDTPVTGAGPISTGWIQCLNDEACSFYSGGDFLARSETGWQKAGDQYQKEVATSVSQQAAQSNDPNGALQKAEKALDTFNGTAGFKASNCASGGSCINALGMAVTAVIAAVASGGESQAGKAEGEVKLISSIGLAGPPL